VAVRYAGYLASGVEFDGSARNGKLLRFVIGQGRVIAGLEEGVTGMHEGGRRRLVIPPALGYGAAGRPGVVPSRATLVFDIELVDLK
jgi:peptidylprolyl isomerase